MSLRKSVLNQKFLIIYKSKQVQIYEILENVKTNLFFKFETEICINSIELNPLIDNIIIISFINGTCKIYNILKKSDKEDILFESVKDDKIELSAFNIYEPNIIATLNSNNDIFIWDVRNFYYLNYLDNCSMINKMKWSYYGKNYLEILNDENEIRLVDINTKKNKSIKEIEGILIDFLYLKNDILLLIKSEKIEKIDLIKNKLMNELEINDITKSNDKLIRDNNILIIMTSDMLYFIDILKLSKINQIKFFDKYNNYFFYIKEKNEIELICNNKSKYELLNEFSFELNENDLKTTNNQYLINIEDKFYKKYCPKILKYMSLLNFKENKTQPQNDIKKYMNIIEINNFFDKIKEINFFKRKDFVLELFNNKEENNNQIIYLNEELNVTNFTLIRKYIKIFDLNETKNRKEKLIQSFIKDLNYDSIIEFYFEIVKLLTIDNTNVKLLEIYLLFLNLFENKIIEKFDENSMEKFKDEVIFYSVCFSKNDYKELFNLEKKSEKEELFNVLTEAYKLKNFDYNNSDFKRFIQKLKNNYKKFPNFNQPIEYDCINNELKWFSVKMHIIITFQKLKLEEKNKNSLLNLRKGLKTVIEYKLLENIDIINNKYMFQSVVYLIINPCQHNGNSLQFFINSLLSKSNNIKELELKYKINDKYQLEYNNIIYDNIKDICISNLDFNEYSKEEKYNFCFLFNNYIKNKNDIKQFLLNILKKKVFVEAYEILFGNNNYKLLDKRYLEEIIEKRFSFVPIKPSGTLAISNKISFNTFISTEQREIISKSNKIQFEHLKEILNTSSYILIGEHEVFHLLNCIPYYENNCSVSINTPRKKNYNGKEEGGAYLELLLFGKIINKINLGDALFLLNENNYDKSLSDFITSFKNKNRQDLIINGIFKDFNNYFNIQEISDEELNNTLIEQKSNYYSNSVFDSYIENYLENDVVGKFLD